MKHNRHIFWILMLLSLSHGKIQEDALKQIHTWFNAPEISTQHQSWIIPEGVALSISKNVGKPFVRKNLDIWQIKSKNNPLAYVVMDNAMGKVQPITYLAAFNLQGQITHIKVLKYRESYGGQIQQSRWLKTFIGRNSKSGWKVGQDIDGISGATISVVAITHALQRLALCTPHFKGAFHETP